MPEFSVQHPVAYSTRQMYDLVADVERYPEFLPLCDSLTVHESRQLENGNTELIATMGVGYKTISEQFTTRVTLQRDELRILVEYLDGPFHHLHNRWHFVPKKNTADGSIVDFHIEYEFKSTMLRILMGALFDKAFRRFAQSFEDRARQIYGKADQIGRVVTP